MKKSIKKCLFLSLFVLLIIFANAQEIIVSVSDFNVESANEKFTYIGKRISTLVAGELRRTKTIKLLERSQKNKIMEEQKLSLTGMVGGFTVKLGKFDINTNITYRKKPVRQLPGISMPNMKALMGVEYNL